MLEYIATRQKEELERITNSRSRILPPLYKYDDSEYRNCYAHAFDINIGYKYRDVFIPGRFSEYAGIKDIKLIARPFIAIYGIEKILKAVISDAEVIDMKAIRTEIDKPNTMPNSYKIFICEDINDNMWHFARESISEDGKKILTHKEGYKNPTSIITRENNYLIGSSIYIIRETLELSNKK